MEGSSWSRSAVVLQPQHERAAREAVKRAGGVAAFELIVLSGSLVAGHGHGYSDVDLHVVPVNGVDVDERAQPVAGVPVQFNLVSAAAVAEIPQLFDQYRASPADRSQLFAMRRWLKVAARLAFGRPLHLSDSFAQWYRNCDPQVIRQLVMSDCAREYGRHAEDAAGGLTAGDPLVALQAADTALRYAMEAALAACGDVYVGETFLWRRFARIDGHGRLAQHAWRLSRCGPEWDGDKHAVRGHVEELLNLGSYLVSRAQLDGWEAPLQRFPEYRPGGGRVRRAPFASVLRLGDVVALIAPDKAYRSNEATARLWLDADRDPSPGMKRFLEMGLLVSDGSPTGRGGGSDV